MKFYIAAKFCDKDRVKYAYVLIKQMGHNITHEWIDCEHVYSYSQEPTRVAQCATNDINGVLTADVFVLLSHAEPSMGASAELGAAIGSFIAFKKPKIFVVGPHFGNNFAFWHPVVIQKNSLDEVLAHIMNDDKKEFPELVQAIKERLNHD